MTALGGMARILMTGFYRVGSRTGCAPMLGNQRAVQMERRRTIRLLTDKGLVALGRCSGELIGAGWPLRDISEGGLRFTVPAGMGGLPTVGDHVVVTVEMATSAPGAAGPRTLKLPAVVRRITKADPQGNCDVSLEFSVLSYEQKSALRGAVLDLAAAKIAERGELLSRSPRLPVGRPEGSRIGDILVARGAITREELEKFMREDYQKGTPLGRQLVARGKVPEGAVAKAIAEQSGLQYVDLDVEGIDLLKIRQIGEELVTKHMFVPISVDARKLVVGAASPLDQEVISTLEQQYNRTVKVMIASERQIISAIQKAFNISRNRRRSARFQADLSVRYKLYDRDWRALHKEVLSGLTKNLSEGGALFLGPIPAGVDLSPASVTGMHVGVHLFLPGQKEPIRLPCDLVRATPVRDGPQGVGALCLYAVQVLDMADEDRRRLSLFRLQACLPRPFADGCT